MSVSWKMTAWTAVEAAGEDEPPQALIVRVGPVFYHDGQAKEPGVWVEYQENYMASLPQGPVLFTPAAWRELSRAVNRHLDRRMPSRWRYLGGLFKGRKLGRTKLAKWLRKKRP